MSTSYTTLTHLLLAVDLSNMLSLQSNFFLQSLNPICAFKHMISSITFPGKLLQINILISTKYTLKGASKLKY